MPCRPHSSLERAAVTELDLSLSKPRISEPAVNYDHRRPARVRKKELDRNGQISKIGNQPSSCGELQMPHFDRESKFRSQTSKREITILSPPFHRTKWPIRPTFDHDDRRPPYSAYSPAVSILSLLLHKGPILSQSHFLLSARSFELRTSSERATSKSGSVSPSRRP